MAMERAVDGTHIVFLRQITVNWAWMKAEGTWSTPETEEVRGAAGNQSATTYIGSRHRKVE